ncbi:hypothetical protein Phi47:1_gp62 [Cellulophaga phage phi47:1]|nr:hypothetical protein Phi3ST:2_gp62 [Cellulophaga phage phi3ST:2]AGO48257.1 hypothetical protein PhiSM_gp62 [Cellulophaga phage phiSM]AGO49301.1 hypothetical protein Phi38:2_gp62 [Cellulophaga phage phi38:2]AGO49381.1 hypothetical protein Phi3:1_gp62 [Cellulophaga phage phi3:1]AGO49799.1 hypothetical protein Phi47:1_gp62 [Cellulophaga phage phi47:1]
MELKARYNDKELIKFSDTLMQLSRTVGFKLSSRGWAYIMEQQGMIDKSQFDKVNTLINNCRKKGFLPIDFVAEEKAREFEGIVEADRRTIYEKFAQWLDWSLNCDSNYDVNWWKDETYYIQMVVEKVDLISLFEPVCRKYKIPIANSKGWSSMLQRAEYARRFKEAEDQGLKCVLLYCGDHDPDGLRISEFLRKNLSDLNNITWEDDVEGYDPENLIIDRFGLNYDFIMKNKFTWIDNLITGGNKNLASPTHKNFSMSYVQDYLKNVGERKCEANVIVTLPQIARNLCTEAIHKYLGNDAEQRFSVKQQQVKRNFANFKQEHNIDEKIEKIINIADNYIE